jgi:integrase
LGINTALRIGDLLNLTLSDVTDSKDEIKSILELKEGKTGKQKLYPLNTVVKSTLESYMIFRKSQDKTLDPKSSLFISRQEQLVIPRQRAYVILSAAGDLLGLPNIGTHTLRKTFLSIIHIYPNWVRYRFSSKGFKSLVKP